MPDEDACPPTELITRTRLSRPETVDTDPEIGEAVRRGTVSVDGSLDDPQVVLQGKFPEYPINGVLGRGGMSTIYRVRDEALGREVALKVLLPELMAEEIAVEKFVNEARITAQLDHPNIPAVYALESDKRGFNVFTMKLLEGRTLHEVIDEHERAGRDGLTECVEILLRICDALAFAHSKGVLHLDLKPSNVIVASFGQIYLVDWGIAKRRTELPAEPCETNLLEGTPAYMAPEQAKGEQWRFDERTDIFALGGLLYRILCSRAPYVAGKIEQMLALATRGEVTPADAVAAEKGRTVPGRLVSICSKAMAPEPEHRYQSVEEFQRDLERYVRGLTQLPQRIYRAGEVIFDEGEPGDAAYVIVSGECAVTRTVGGQVHEIRRLVAGEMFGEVAVFIGKPRSAAVRAVTDAVVSVVEKALMVEEMERKSFMSLAIRTVTSTFFELDRQLTQHRRRSRVIELALRHIAIHGEGGRTPWQPLLAMIVECTGASEDDVLSCLKGAEGLVFEGDSLVLVG